MFKRPRRKRHSYVQDSSKVTIEEVCKDTLASYIAKIEFETRKALQVSHERLDKKETEIKKLNVKFAEMNKKERVMLKLIRDERIKVKLLEEKIELMHTENIAFYDANIEKEIEQILEEETEDEKIAEINFLNKCLASVKVATDCENSEELPHLEN